MTEPIYEKPDSVILRHFIELELEKNHLSPKTEIPAIARKKLIFTCIFSLITLALLSTVFFHIETPVWKLEYLNIGLYIFFMFRFNTMSYLMKEVKSRPDEDIGYIVTSLMSESSSRKRSLILRLSIIAVSLVLPVLIFFQPHMIFEHSDEGCYLRFYTKGILPQHTVEVPAQHRGEDVVGIRGEVFCDMPELETVILPDTIDVIRGYAFAYCPNLTTVVMPETLSYLGGSAFEHCSSLENIVIPEGLTEIKGSTFDGCSSLDFVVIPEGVTRIGGHAFYYCVSLEDVVFPSTLQEIGSSAFRDCWALGTVFLPEGVEVDERAFKDCDAEILYW